MGLHALLGALGGVEHALGHGGHALAHGAEALGERLGQGRIGGVGAHLVLPEVEIAFGQGFEIDVGHGSL
ncbi:MAG: hypothetical protein HZC25_09920 [Rhodospirillales bacterium]|nr:hypothetical protein [Rhodospirillales bacterium]